MNALNRGGSSQTQRDPDARQDRGQFDIPELESLVHRRPSIFVFTRSRRDSPTVATTSHFAQMALRAGG